MTTDPIADLLTRIRNATKARLRKVDVPPSQMKLAVVDIMKKTGFIKNYKLYKANATDKTGILRIYLKYVGKNRPVIQGLSRVSRPSRRVYTRVEKIPKVMDGMGIAVISTSRGILTDQAARENRVGGEVLCSIW
jgi:small subunit ribosomal protein S8